MDPDGALMLRVKRGDIKAFEVLAEKYKQPIVNMMYRMLHDLDEAEDLAQNVFVRVYQSAGRYEGSAKFSTWIFTIARRLCLNEIRRRGRHPAESLESSQSDNEEQAPRQFEDVLGMANLNLQMLDADDQQDAKVTALTKNASSFLRLPSQMKRLCRTCRLDVVLLIPS